jgi:ferredoxin
MAYHRVICYFHSGTGNSFLAATWLAQAAERQGAAIFLTPVERARPIEKPTAGSGQLVGIYHPTHGLMPSWSMIKFLFRLPWGRGAHAMIVSTRGALPIGPVIIPGGAGLGLFLPWLILLVKGYKVRGGRGVDMPANMLNLHWGFTADNIERVLNLGKRRHDRLAERVLAGRRYWSPFNLLWELIWCFPFVLWPLYPLIYLMVGRVFMAKLMFSDTNCVGCGRCARNCPSQAIIMIGSNPKVPFWTRRCEACMRCMGYCKFKAIQASHIWIVPVIFATSFVSADVIQTLLSTWLGLDPPQFKLAYELIAILFTFLSLPLLYYLFWGLQRIRPLRVFFSYATLTKYYSRRYHAPRVTPRQMNRPSDAELPGED